MRFLIHLKLKTHHKSPLMKWPFYLASALLSLPVLQGASLVLVNDNFNNGNFASVGGGDVGAGHVVFNNGDKNVVETTSAAWTAGGTGGWIRTELHSLDEINGYNLLTAQGYSALQYSWTIRNVSPLRATTNTGTDAPYRIQFGALPSARTQGTDNEMWVNTAGGVWLDMSFNTNGVVNYTVYDANDTKTNGSDGASRASGSIIGWDGVAPRTFTLTLAGSGYEWSDSAGSVFGGTTYATAGLDTELVQDWWGFAMGQNRDTIGTGTHELIRFSVVAVPEPASAMLGFAGLGMLLARRKTRR